MDENPSLHTTFFPHNTYVSREETALSYKIVDVAGNMDTNFPALIPDLPSPLKPTQPPATKPHSHLKESSDPTLLYQQDQDTATEDIEAHP